MGFLAPLVPAVVGGTATAGTLAAETLAVTAVAGGYSAYSAIQQGNYQAQVAKMNANIAEQNREAENTKGAADAEREHLVTGRRIGSALAAQGASGVDTGFGTTQESRDAMQAVGDLDAKTLQYNAQIRGLGFANQEAGLLADASMAKAAGTNKALGSVLSTSSSVLSSALKYKTTGVL